MSAEWKSSAKASLRAVGKKSSVETSLDKSQEGGKQKENNKSQFFWATKIREKVTSSFDSQIQVFKMSLTQKALLTICQGGTVNTPVLQVLQVSFVSIIKTFAGKNHSIFTHFTLDAKFEKSFWIFHREISIVDLWWNVQ